MSLCHWHTQKVGDNQTISSVSISYIGQFLQQTYHDVQPETISQKNNELSLESSKPNMKSVHLHRQLGLTLSMHLFNVNMSHVILFQSLLSKTLDLLVSRISRTVYRFKHFNNFSNLFKSNQSNTHKRDLIFQRDDESISSHIIEYKFLLLAN